MWLFGPIAEVRAWVGESEVVVALSGGDARFEVPERPRIEVDNREVVEARWFPKERALSLNLFPPLRKVIRARG